MMPPLPESDYLLAIPDQPYDRGYTTSEDGYTAEQMLSYGAACRAEALEEAAKVCDDIYICSEAGEDQIAERCAAAIRALKDKL